MWKRPACGPLLTCSFHKCLLFFNSGNKQSTLGVCACVRVHNQRTCSVHTNRHANTVWEWGGWGFRACECTYLHGTCPTTPITAHPGGGDKWPTSTDLVLFICLCFSSIFIIPAPAAAFLVSADIFTAFHLILLAGGPRPSYMHIY